MKKKIILSLICGILCAGIAFGIYYYITNNNNNNPVETPNNNENTNLVLNKENNEQVITTNSNSTIRVINHYDEKMFKDKNTVLFMWSSWCPNCQSEMEALNDILKKYKNDEDVNIVFIAHEFEQEDGNINGLTELLEGGTIDFDTEILLDFDRVIRKQIDPEEGYIPRTYFLDKECNVLEEIEEPVTYEQVESLINKYYKADD